MIHVGMDLHSKNSYVGAITDECELINARRINHSDIDKLWDYLRQFGKEEKHVVFEATSNARWMYRLLKEDATIDLITVTPHKVRCQVFEICDILYGRGRCAERYLHVFVYLMNTGV